MRLYGITSKAEQKYRKKASEQRNNMDKNDADIITSTLDALLQLDQEIARKLIMNPSTIKGLMDKGAKHNLKCVYALHAIVAALVGSDMSEILNQMTDSNISILKDCVSIAKGSKQMSIETIDKHIQQRRNDAKKHLDQQRAMENSCMIKSLQIYREVNADLWDASCESLQQLSDTLDHFERAPQKTLAIVPNDSSLCNMKDLAELLGTTDTKQIHNLKNNNKSKTDKMFVNVGNRTMFKFEYFDELKQMFEASKCVRTPKNDKAKTQKKETKATSKKQHGSGDKPAKKKRKTMLDVKAADKYASELIALCEQQKSARDKALADRTAIQQQIANATDDDTIAELSIKLTQANDQVKTTRTALDGVQSMLDEYTHAAEKKAAAEKALKEQDKLLKDIKAKVDEFLTKGK